MTNTESADRRRSFCTHHYRGEASEYPWAIRAAAQGQSAHSHMVVLQLIKDSAAVEAGRPPRPPSTQQGRHAQQLTSQGRLQRTVTSTLPPGFGDISAAAASVPACPKWHRHALCVAEGGHHAQDDDERHPALPDCRHAAAASKEGCCSSALVPAASQHRSARVQPEQLRD